MNEIEQETVNTNDVIDFLTGEAIKCPEKKPQSLKSLERGWEKFEELTQKTQAALLYAIGIIHMEKEPLYQEIWIAHYFTPAAKLGYSKAWLALHVFADEEESGKLLLTLAQMYTQEKNSVAAHFCHSLAAQKENFKAVYYLGNDYENGIGVEKDIEFAIDCYSVAANENVKEALDALILLANEGHKNTQYKLAKIHKDPQKAAEYYAMAAKQGHEKAYLKLKSDTRYLFKLAEIEHYRNNFGEAVICYQRLLQTAHNALAQMAKENAIQAQKSSINNCILPGDVKALTVLADEGHKHAQYELAKIYHYRTPHKAACYFAMAAKQGHEKAYEELKAGTKGYFPSEYFIQELEDVEQYRKKKTEMVACNQKHLQTALEALVQMAEEGVIEAQEALRKLYELEKKNCFAYYFWNH